MSASRSESQQRVDHCRVFGARVFGVLTRADQGPELNAFLVGRRRVIEGAGAVCAGQHLDVDDLLVAYSASAGEFGDGRGAPQRGGELLGGLDYALLEVLEMPRDADHPAVVAEVAFELAEDRRHRE